MGKPWDRVSRKYRKSPFVAKKANFHLKWLKCRDLQHLGSWKSACGIILGCYKNVTCRFWKFSFLANFCGVKIQFLVIFDPLQHHWWHSLCNVEVTAIQYHYSHHYLWFCVLPSHGKYFVQKSLIIPLPDFKFLIV